MNAGTGHPSRTPPQNVDAEQSILSAILLDNEAIFHVQELLSPPDFYRESHQIIYANMLKLAEGSIPVDSITLVEELRRQNVLEKIGGAAYVSHISDLEPTAANVSYYATLVKEKALRRNLIGIATEIVAEGYGNEGDTGDIIDAAQKSILGISDSTSRQHVHPLSDILRSNFEIIEKRFENKKSITGLTSGFKDLDGILGGFQNSEMIVLAARPSMGKTALALNFALNTALADHTPVLIFSLEMSKEQLCERLLCSQARIDSQRIRTGFLKEDDWKKLANAAGILSDAKIFIDDSVGIRISDIRARARRVKKENNIGLVIIDYLQFVRIAGRFNNKEQEIAEISRSVKDMAKELGLPVIALSQLNRSAEGRNDRRPMMSDLRESGAIEQDADVILFIYRDVVYNPDTEEPAKAEVKVAKHRNGPTGIAYLRFSNEYTRFENYAYENE
jgi:replicative DNA helicase